MPLFPPALRRALTAGLAALALVFAAPLTPASAHGKPVTTPANWIISTQAIHLIDGVSGSGSLAQNAFDNPATEEVGVPAAGWSSAPTASFTFYGPASKTTSFLYALKNGTIPPGTVYVMLDMEKWSLTPHSQQIGLGKYEADFVNTAHQNGYKAILAPAADVTIGMPCQQQHKTDPLWKLYLTDCAIPALSAQAAADVFEIQSQGYEANTSTNTDCGCFAWFVAQAAAQAQAADSGLDVRAGLSTNPSGKTSSGPVLYQDTTATESNVDGYWLNVPERGNACPNCQPGGEPQVAVAYLEQLGYTPSSPKHRGGQGRRASAPAAQHRPITRK